MGVTKQDITELLELANGFLDNAEEFKPIVAKGLSMIEGLAKDLQPLLEKLTDYVSEQRVKKFKWYIKEGMTRDEAITFCIADIENMRAFSNNMQKNTKNNKR